MLLSRIFDQIETDFFIFGVSDISSFFSKSDFNLFKNDRTWLFQYLINTFQVNGWFLWTAVVDCKRFQSFLKVLCFYSSEQIYIEIAKKDSKFLEIFLLSSVVNRNVHLRVQETHCENWHIKRSWKWFSIEWLYQKSIKTNLSKSKLPWIYYHR